MRYHNALVFSPDGLRAWQISDSRDVLFEYVLSSAWDVSTMKIDYTKQATQMHGYLGEEIDQMAFNNDGTKMYFAVDDNQPVASTDKLIQVDLGTAYDTSTIDASSVAYLTAVHPTAPHTHVEAFCFSANGSYLYITDDSVDDIFQFTLSTPWDITTASYTAIKESTGNTYGLHISSDGSSMYIMQLYALKQCAMSTPYDITTLNYSSPTNELAFTSSTYTANLPSTQINTPELLDIAISPDGTKFVMFGDLQSEQYHMQSITLSTPWDISVSSQSSSTLKHKFVSMDYSSDTSFAVSPDGSKFFTTVSSYQKGFKQFTLANTGNLQSIQIQAARSTVNGKLVPDVSSYLTSASGDGTYGDVPSGITFADGLPPGNMSPSHMSFNHNGTKLIFRSYSTTNNAHLHLFQWNCPTPYDLTSISSTDMVAPYYVDTRVITGATSYSNTSCMTFSGDGSKFYMIIAGQILQFSCPTNGSIFSMTYDIDSGGNETGHFVNNGANGGKFYPIAGSTAGTMTHLGGNASVNTAALQGITWHPDGYKFYLATNVMDAFPCIVELSVATPWDLFTVENPLKHRWATFGGKFYATTQRIADFVGDIQWNSDGTILYTTIKTARTPYLEPGILPESNVLEFPYIDDAMSYNGINAESPYNLKWAYADDIFYHNLAEPTAFQIKPDGTKFWLCDNTTDDVIEYNMSTPHQLSSATIGNRLLNVETNASGMYFAPDGSHLVTCGYSSDKVRKWDMSTAWDISTATVDATQEIALSSGGTTDGMLWVQYNNDGTKIYVFEEEITIATMSAKLLEYPLSTAYDLSTAGTPYVWLPHSSVVQPDRPTQTWSDDALNISTGRFNGFGDVLTLSTYSPGVMNYSFTLSTAWDLSTINNTPTGQWASPYQADRDRMVGTSVGQDHLVYLDQKHIFRIYKS